MIPVLTDKEIEIMNKWMGNDPDGDKIKEDCPPREREILERIIKTIEDHNG